MQIADELGAGDAAAAHQAQRREDPGQERAHPALRAGHPPVHLEQDAQGVPRRAHHALQALRAQLGPDLGGGPQGHRGHGAPGTHYNNR